MRRGRALRRRYGHAAVEGILSAEEVARLPVGSIVWHGSALIVIPGGQLTQVAVLPERADGPEPGGEPAGAWGREFALVALGHGKLPTHGTAMRKAMAWWKTPSGIEARRHIQGLMG